VLPEKKRDLQIVAITQVIAYIFLFLIAGYIMMGNDDKIAFPIVFICTVIIYVVSFIKYPVKLTRWIWGIPIMWGLIMLYCPGDAYGISDPGPFGILDYPAWFDALIFVIKLFLLQCAIKLVLFMGKVVKKKVFPM
jgi:hypothetical protein